MFLTHISCSFFQPTARFFIINESYDKKNVDIKVILGKQIVFEDTIKYINIRPDRQYMTNNRQKAGKYTITVTADNGKVQVQQPIILEGDRFIFVTYSYKAPVDSVTLAKKLGHPFAGEIKGQEPKIGIHITDKEPVHL